MSESWHRFYLELADFWAQKRSKDPSTKVAAILVDDQFHQIGAGYNGFPRGVEDRPEDYANREIKYKKVVHAEVNAILNAVGRTRGATLYCTFFPCPQCAAMLIQAGIKRVVASPSPSDHRWAAERAIAEEMFRQVGIEILIINKQEVI